MLPSLIVQLVYEWLVSRRTTRQARRFSPIVLLELEHGRVRTLCTRKQNNPILTSGTEVTCREQQCNTSSSELSEFVTDSLRIRLWVYRCQLQSHRNADWRLLRREQSVRHRHTKSRSPEAGSSASRRIVPRPSSPHYRLPVNSLRQKQARRAKWEECLA